MNCLIVKDLLCWRGKDKIDDGCSICLVNTHNNEIKKYQDKLSRRNMQIKTLKESLTKSDEAMKRIVNYVVNTPLDKRLSLPHELFVAIDKALARPTTR